VVYVDKDKKPYYIDTVDYAGNDLFRWGTMGGPRVSHNFGL
jgi:hypothetical protein